MQVPKSISPSPLLEAVIEIRFDSSLPSVNIFGRMYAELVQEYGETEELPILTIPVELRESNQDFKHAPHYRLKNDKFIINIGQRIVSINRICKAKNYEGWEELKVAATHVVEVFSKNTLINEATKLSVRYINFFDDKSIKEVSTFGFSIDQAQISEYKDLSVNYTIKLGSSSCRTILSSNATLPQDDGSVKNGSVIDIDGFIEDGCSLSEFEANAELLHQQVEKSFFETLSKDYMETLEVKND